MISRIKDLITITKALRKITSSLAVLLFFCLFLCAIKLSFWQFERYEDKKNIENALKEPVQNYRDLNWSLNQLPDKKSDGQEKKTLQAYYPFSYQLSLASDQMVYQILNPQGRAYQLYCPTYLEHDLYYLKKEQVVNLNEKTQKFLVDQNQASSGFSQGFLEDSCQRNFEQHLKTLAFVPVQKNRFIPSYQEDNLDNGVRYQLSDFLETQDFYLVENPGTHLINMTSKKHLGYCLQWFLLSLLSLFFLLRAMKKLF